MSRRERNLEPKMRLTTTYPTTKSRWAESARVRTSEGCRKRRGCDTREELDAMER